MSAKRKPPEKGDIKDDSMFVQPHVYRQIRKIDMGPVVAAALEAVFERRWRRAAN